MPRPLNPQPPRWSGHLAGCLVSALLLPLSSQAEVRWQDAVYLPASDEVRLTWSGDSQAYGVEMSTGLDIWVTILITREHSARIAVNPDQAIFLRVAELEESEEQASGTGDETGTRETTGESAQTGSGTKTPSGG